MKRLYIAFFILMMSFSGFSQVIVNESFEQGNTDGEAPVDWICDDDGWRCGFQEQDHNRIPHSGDWYVYAKYNREKWMYKEITTEANSVYRISFWYVTNGVGHFDFEIKAGNAANPSSMTTTILPETVIENTEYQYMTLIYESETAGTKYIGFHYTADNLTWYLSLDDIVIEKTEPYNFSAEQLTPDTTVYFGEYGHFRFNVSNTGSETETINFYNISGDYQNVTFTKNGNTITTYDIPVGATLEFTAHGQLPMNLSPNQYVILHFDITSMHNTHLETMVFTGTALKPIDQFPLTEGFDGETFPPSGWQNACLVGDEVFERFTVGEWPMCNPHNGSDAMARYYSYLSDVGDGAMLVSPKMQLSATDNIVRFWIFRNYNSWQKSDRINVYYSPTPSVEGATLLGTVHRHTELEPVVENVDDWYEYSYTFDCPDGYGFVIFEAVSDRGWNLFIDDIFVNSTTVDNDPPAVVSVAGTQQWADTDMEITIRIYDESDVPDEMEATYTIDGQSHNITFHKSSKSNYDFTGTIPAQPNHTAGEIVFNLEDELGHTATSDSYEIHWDWQRPLLLEGFEGEQFPPQDWMMESANMSWFVWSRVGTTYYTDSDNYEYVVVPKQGVKQAALEWDYTDEAGMQDEHLISPMLTIDRPTALSFETFCHYGFPYHDHFTVSILNTNTGMWNEVWDAADLPFGINQYDEKVNIDLSDYQGQNIRIKWRGYNSDASQLWYSWFIDNVKVVPTDTTGVSVDEITMNDAIVYPNPFSNTLTISGEETIQNICIFNLLGIKVDEFTINNKKAVLDLSELEDGMYIVEIISKNGKSIKSAIKK